MDQVRVRAGARQNKEGTREPFGEVGEGMQRGDDVRCP